jgi:hypothetical protein
MEQTPQPLVKEETPSEENAVACPPGNPVEEDTQAREHVVPSGKEIDISDEDRALDSGI